MSDETPPAEGTAGGNEGPTTERPATDGGHDDHGLPGTHTVRRWLVTTNHKDVGILYTVTSLFFLVVAGVLAVLFRTQLWTPGSSILGGGGYNQAVTAHGLLMVFWFLSPFAFGLANYFVPLQIGARDLAFPRLNALSYWLYLFSGLLFVVSFFQGSTLAGGWTMYMPLNIPAYMPWQGATVAVLALVLFVASVTVSSVNFLVTMHRMRARGLSLRKMPIFSWTILLTVWMMLFAFAALLAAMVIFASDRLVGTTYLHYQLAGAAPNNEAAPLLWTHLFWFFGHPEVYIVFFPALGVMAETFQTFSGRRLVGRKWFIASMVLVAVQSFLVWMHHMFLTGINLEVQTLFMATTIGISLPFDLMVFSLIYTTIKGRVRFTTPFLFSLGALVLFIIGGITGVFLGAIVLDYEFRGTYWVVAHFHYVMVGGVTALIGGLYYWFPKMTGKMYDETLGKLHFAIYFVGFNLVYFPMFVVWETPRRVFEFPPEFTVWHQVATVGAFVLGASFLVMFYNLYRSVWHGPDAEDCPWEYGSTAEWTVSSPPPLENFPGVPDYSGGSLTFESEAEATDGGAAAGHEPSHASIWPFVVALASFVALLGLSGFQGGTFVGGLDGAIYGTMAVVGTLGLGWSLVELAREPFHGPGGGLGSAWPFQNIGNTKLGVWFFLASDVVLFGAFIGSYVFIRVSHGWRDWHHLIPEAHVAFPGLVNTYLLLTSSFSVVLALVAAERQSRRGLLAALVTTFGLGVAFLVNKGLEWNHLFHVHSEAFPAGWGLSTNVASSTFYLTTGLHALHVIGGLLITLYLIARAYRGAYLDDPSSVEYFGLYWHFVDIVWLFLFPLFYIV